VAETWFSRLKTEIEDSRDLQEILGVKVIEHLLWNNISREQYETLSSLRVKRILENWHEEFLA